MSQAVSPAASDMQDWPLDHMLELPHEICQSIANYLPYGFRRSLFLRVCRKQKDTSLAAFASAELWSKDITLNKESAASLLRDIPSSWWVSMETLSNALRAKDEAEKGHQNGVGGISAETASGVSRLQLVKQIEELFYDTSLSKAAAISLKRLQAVRQLTLLETPARETCEKWTILASIPGECLRGRGPFGSLKSLGMDWALFRNPTGYPVDEFIEAANPADIWSIPGSAGNAYELFHHDVYQEPTEENQSGRSRNES